MASEVKNNLQRFLWPKEQNSYQNRAITFDPVRPLLFSPYYVRPTIEKGRLSKHAPNIITKSIPEKVSD